MNCTSCCFLFQRNEAAKMLGNKRDNGEEDFTLTSHVMMTVNMLSSNSASFNWPLSYSQSGALFYSSLERAKGQIRYQAENITVKLTFS